jgi:transcriptional regulator with XRE-family HTH domain
LGEFPAVLKRLRTQHGITQTELAKRLRIAKSTVSMYECGAREPDLETLEKIAETLCTDMNTLLGQSQTVMSRGTESAGSPGALTELRENFQNLSKRSKQELLDFSRYLLATQEQNKKFANTAYAVAFGGDTFSNELSDEEIREIGSMVKHYLQKKFVISSPHGSFIRREPLLWRMIFPERGGLQGSILSGPQNTSKEKLEKSLSIRLRYIWLNKDGGCLVYLGDTNELIERLHLTDYVMEELAFKYETQAQKLVFVREDLDEATKIYRILHETGHILLEHKADDSGLSAEREANLFAELCLAPTHAAWNWAAIICCATAVTGICIAVFIVGSEPHETISDFSLPAVAVGDDGSVPPSPAAGRTDCTTSAAPKRPQAKSSSIRGPAKNTISPIASMAGMEQTC